jgi:hypothetical protein
VAGARRPEPATGAAENGAGGGTSKGCVGCLTAVAGLFSGAMFGVLVSLAVAWIRKAPGCPDIPTCDWNVYAGVGAVIGLITLPTMVLLRLRRDDARRVAEAANSERG